MRPNAPSRTPDAVGLARKGHEGMTLIACEGDDFPVLARRSAIPDLIIRATGATALLTLVVAVGGALLFGQAGDQGSRARAAPAAATPPMLEGLFAPAPFSPRTANIFGQSVPLRAAWVAAQPVEATPTIVAAAVPMIDAPRELFGPEAPVSPLLEVADSDVSVPLPLPRPAEFSAKPIFPTTRRAASLAPTAPDTNSPKSDGRGIFERLFGSREPSGPALAYANPNDGLSFPRAAESATSGGGGTAIYDISAKTVFMPDGTRLEAHSGLREMLDDPSNVHVRMRGATPPATYDLRLRESLFHGVQAIRLTPVNSSVHGRTGLLAHTYMLGPNGDSNGCVSFRDYNAFLQAFIAGKVSRLTVVARR